MSDVRYWIGFNLVPRVGPATIVRLFDQFGDLEHAWRADATHLRTAGVPRNALDNLLNLRTRLDLDQELTKVRSAGLDIITWDSPSYPSLLKNITYPPPLLYVKGELIPTDEWAVAIVGTRRASAYGKEVARRLATGLAENDITIVSGLALGIDGVAHRTALEAGGRTLAVMGCGLDTIYPARHEQLAEQIASSGALITDYALGVKPDARNFPPRNRIISGLSLGTVVVEAGIKSGALITVQFALDQGRETFAVPGNIYNRSSMGTNALLRRGEAKLITEVKDVVEELNLTMATHQRQVREVAPETPDEQALLTCISAEPIHVDELVRQSGMPTASVTSTLCMMELKGMVRRVDNMSYVLAH